jgi:hypothetical protein
LPSGDEPAAVMSVMEKSPLLNQPTHGHCASA